MTLETSHTYREIKSQTRAWVQALGLASQLALPAAREYDQAIFTGCGSTYYLSLAAAALFQELTGRPAKAVPAGELLLNHRSALTDQKTILMAISRSGTTTETVRAVENFRKSGRGPVLVVSNYGEQLANLGDSSVVIDEGQEESVAQTRSFSSMYVAVAAWCARMAGRDDLLLAYAGLPAAGDRLIAGSEPFAKTIGADLRFDRFYFLGSGILYGLACEANLKMKEMTLTHSEPFHFLEFRHGPMSMVNQNAVIVGLLSESNRESEARVLSEMAAFDGTVVSLGERGPDVAFESGLPESARGVLYLPFLQLMAAHRSEAKGLDPDRPMHLEAVVKLAA